MPCPQPTDLEIPSPGNEMAVIKGARWDPNFSGTHIWMTALRLFWIRVMGYSHRNPRMWCREGRPTRDLRVVSDTRPWADIFQDPSHTPCWLHPSLVWVGPCPSEGQMSMMQTQKHLATPHRNRWQDLLSIFPGSFLDGNGLSRQGPQTERTQEFYLTLTLLLTPSFTNAIEILSHSKAGHFYLWSRQDPFLIIANGNIHHPVSMALKKAEF